MADEPLDKGAIGPLSEDAKRRCDAIVSAIMAVNADYFGPVHVPEDSDSLATGRGQNNPQLVLEYLAGLIGRLSGGRYTVRFARSELVAEPYDGPVLAICPSLHWPVDDHGMVHWWLPGMILVVNYASAPAMVRSASPTEVHERRAKAWAEVRWRGLVKDAQTAAETWRLEFSPREYDELKRIGELRIQVDQAMSAVGTVARLDAVEALTLLDGDDGMPTQDRLVLIYAAAIAVGVVRRA